MATGRTIQRYTRFYAHGYDLSGIARTVGDLKWEFDAPLEAALTDNIKNVAALGQCSLSPGTLNAFMDDATPGLHTVFNPIGGTGHTVMIPIGIRGAPAQGDPVYAGYFEQLGYAAKTENGYAVVTIPWGEADAQSAILGYNKPWGILLHAKGAETGTNSATGVDDNAASSSYGGFMCYQIFSSDGTVTIKVQDAATNTDVSFADLTGATSGVVDASSTPVAGLVALGRTATVRRYLRWQLVLGTANTVTFALSFHRALF